MKVSATAKTGIRATLGLLLITVAVLGASGGSTPITAAHVDLSRYSGRWYTIANKPSWFEEGCTGSTTDYTLLPNGEMKVVNRCHKGSLDGPVKTHTGKAWVVEPRTNAKLKVRFYWFFTSDFWIFDVSPDYQTAIIGTPDGHHLYLISRTPVVSKTDYKHMIARADEKGLDTSRLHKILQPGMGRATASR